MTLPEQDADAAAEAGDEDVSNSADPVELSHDARTDEDLAELSYEQARDELVSVVQRLETGGVPLAESLALWERGEKLAGICQQWLDGAKQRVEAARETADQR